MQGRLETAIAGSLLALAVAFSLFMDMLVAKPKTLFGRSLNAIEPSSFPYLAMGLMVLLCGLFFFARYRRADADDGDADAGPMSEANWLNIAAFFAILLVYALMFKPVGFLISTFIAMVFLSLLAGSRHYLQIVLFALLLPLAFYLLATRVLLVSLPEQPWLELLIARVLGG